MEDDITLNAEKTHSTIVKLPASILARLHDYAAATDTSISAVIQAALEKDEELRRKLQLSEGYRTPKHKRRAVA
jgi:hypothetical protein